MKHLIDLLDRGELYDIFRNFGDMSGLGVSLRDLEGKELMSYYKDGGACICNMINGNPICVKNVSYSGRLAANLGEPYIYVCGCGLVMSASAVMLEDDLIGAVFCGPAMLWDADEYALDELEKNTVHTVLTDADRKHIAANTPQYSCCQIRSASGILFRLVNYMCRSHMDILNQRQEITKQQATISVLMSENRQQLTAGKRTGFYSPENEKKLMNSVRFGDKTAARRQLNNVLADVFLYSGGKLMTIKAKIYELIGFLFRAASEAGAAQEELLKAARESQKILEDEISFEDLCYCTSVTIERFIDAVYNGGRNIPGARYLAAAMTFIAENYACNITIKDVAFAVEISTSYLSHLFHDGLGTTFISYLTSIRIEAAKELLMASSLTVTEISARVGYTDTNYFIRAFKKSLGISPGQYRQQNTVG
ncbi:helix-turn-helix domain-containing protein [Lachnotalea sp. AF33-28]|uniref:helix-turn-helix domain-containing protein n=1 Tax=Lachnotalea sp. AF33-28 TaxID=2292046 RepID=UPI000E52CD1F|nr:PocR ligand-binding domain-containing protein [Lachnotalea sp. AF33-28]RHP29897.1 helix-turn-helix domain-containing protein [Lachnotalea sp. AF33-28]